MTPERVKAARELLAFYAEAGVDALLGEAPVDRLAAARTEAMRPADVPPEPAHRPAAPPWPSRPETLPLATAAAAPAPDVAVMAAREAARGAATLGELGDMLGKFEGCAS